MKSVSKYCTFYIVRHGETDWNVEDVYQGQQHNSLNAKGLLQAHTLNSRLKSVHFEAVFSSDLLRAKQTAEIIAAERKLIVQTTNLVRERKMGIFEGKKREIYLQNIKDLLLEFAAFSEEKKWKFKFAKDIESDMDIAERFTFFIQSVAKNYLGKNILVVSHNIIIVIFLMRIGYLPYTTTIPIGSFKNGGFIKLKSNGTDFLIEKAQGLDKEKFK